jgi:hypothetical protein
MTDIREMTDVRELNRDEMAGVEGGLYLGDGYCGTPVPHGPIPLNPLPSPVLPVVNIPVMLPIIAITTSIG